MPTFNIEVTCENCGITIMTGTIYVEQGNVIMIPTGTHNCKDYEDDEK